jgi:hypothetical protein
MKKPKAAPKTTSSREPLAVVDGHASLFPDPPPAAAAPAPEGGAPVLIVEAFDLVRSTFPNLGLALYALTPGAEVTLEIHDADGQLYTFKAPTAEECLQVAFPAQPQQTEPAAPPGIFD